jgi:hemolysin activation/secretion protein
MQRFIPVAFIAPIATFAQQLPDAGQLLQQIRPAAQPPARQIPGTSVEERPAARPVDGQRVLVQGFRITGSSVIPQDELLPLVSDAIGKELSLAELDALTQRITRRLREAGLFVARAYLPAQDIRNGVVEIAVLEGRLGGLQVENTAGLAPSALAPVDSLTSGDPVTRKKLEDTLLALAELPGTQLKSVLRPGSAVGTSDLLVTLTPGPAFSGSANIDNYGNRYTGATQLAANLLWNNPSDHGDQASLRAETTGSGFNYARLGYQVPFGRSATRMGATGSYMHYRLGKDFEVLDADGHASIGSVFVLYPFLRGRDANWWGQFQYDRKQLVDRVGAVAASTEKTLGNWTAGVSGNVVDTLAGGATNSLSLVGVRGHLALDATTAVIDQVTAASAGNFSKWTASFQRAQNLPAEFSMLFSASGQWSSKNLDSSEKFSLGGAYGVRAYPQGEALGDEGRLLSLELRRPLAQNWDARLFYDDGRVTTNRRPWTTADNSRHLAGYGVGVAYATGRFALRMFAAWKGNTGQPTSDPDRTPRVWAQGVTYF